MTPTRFTPRLSLLNSWSVRCFLSPFEVPGTVQADSLLRGTDSGQESEEMGDLGSDEHCEDRVEGGDRSWREW